MQCQYKNCDKQANWNIQMNGENKFYCTKHKKEIGARWYNSKLTPIGYKPFNKNDNWILFNKNNFPDNFKKIEISDGKIVDTGFVVGTNWYFDNYYEIIEDSPRYWRYV